LSPESVRRQRVSTFTEMEPSGEKVGRFWVDVSRPQRQREPCAGVCRTPSIAKQSSASTSNHGVQHKQTFTSTTAPATRSRSAEKWIGVTFLAATQPVKPATISGWQHSLDKMVFADLATTPADVGNAALKAGRKNVLCGLSRQHRHSLQVVKMVVCLGCKFRRRTDSFRK